MSTIASITTILTMIIVNYFNLGPLYVVPLTTALDGAIKYITNEQITFNLSNILQIIFSYGWYILFLVITYVVVRFGKQHFLQKILQSYDIEFIIYDKPTMQKIMKYFEYYSDSIEVCSIEKGTAKYIGTEKYDFVSYNSPTRFNIDHLTGTIQTLFMETKIDLMQKVGGTPVIQNVDVPYLKIILDTKMSFIKFMELIEYKITIHNGLVKKDHIKLYGVEFICNDRELMNIDSVFYNVPRDIHSIDDIWNSYFCTNKRQLKKLVDSGSFNLLLHGPPGSGKSKFIEIIAKIMERHIVSINLKHCYKTTLLRMLLTPHINATSYRTKDAIFVFEEFDQTVEYLITKKECFENKIKTLSLSKKDDDILSTLSKSSNELYLNDLLEIFQSSIPREGQIIIATSNHYESMKEKLPALFRPGRLTPLHMGYVDQITFNEIVDYYYPNRELTSEHISLPIRHNIPTSQIIEIAKINHHYADFSEQIKELL